MSRGSAVLLKFDSCYFDFQSLLNINITREGQFDQFGLCIIIHEVDIRYNCIVNCLWVTVSI
jgi:hypothetical protein